MNFDLSEEQELVASSIARFVERDYAFETRRTIVAAEQGYSDGVWAQMAELGLLGLTLPVEHGGLGGGAVGAMSLMQAVGAALVVEPWLACIGVAAQLIARGGSVAQRQRLLPAVAAGTCKLAFAHMEDEARHRLSEVTTRLRPTGDGYLVCGVKRLVPYAATSDRLIVSARSAQGAVTLLVVPRGAAGVRVFPLRMLDGTRAADVAFEDVRVDADALLPIADALPLIEEVVDFATALVCAEAVGAIGYAKDATLDYLKTREQFGVPIGSFQALQHRMVDLLIEHEQAKSMASLACSAVDAAHEPRGRARIVSAAKLRIAEACRRVAQESVQLHGGMGMSDELKISHTFRRLTAIAQQFGDADHHLERFVALSAPQGAHP